MTDLTPAMQTAAEADVLSPVIIARLDFEGDPLTVWDGPGIFVPTATGDAALDGQTFTSVGNLGQISNIVSTDGISDPLTAALSGVDIDDPLLRQIIRDKRAWRGREAWVWMGFIDMTDPDRPIVIHPIRLKYAYMTKISTNRDRETGVVTVIIDEDLDRAQGHIYRYADQRNYFPTDTAGDFMHQLANSPTGIHGPAWGKPVNVSHSGFVQRGGRFE